MSWLRIDDGFADHHKIAELTDREFRVWMRVLCYAARHKTACGQLTPAMRKQVIGLTSRTESRLISIGLLHKGTTENGHKTLDIHDWVLYSDLPVSRKVNFYLTEKDPEASANDVYRAIGGKRELVLAEVARFRSGSLNGSREPDPEP